MNEICKTECPTLQDIEPEMLDEIIMAGAAIALRGIAHCGGKPEVMPGGWTKCHLDPTVRAAICGLKRGVELQRTNEQTVITV